MEQSKIEIIRVQILYWIQQEAHSQAEREAGERVGYGGAVMSEVDAQYWFGYLMGLLLMLYLFYRVAKWLWQKGSKYKRE